LAVKPVIVAEVEVEEIVVDVDAPPLVDAPVIV
jgi:hypothetical protein